MWISRTWSVMSRMVGSADRANLSSYECLSKALAPGWILSR